MALLASYQEKTDAGHSQKRFPQDGGSLRRDEEGNDHRRGRPGHSGLEKDLSRAETGDIRNYFVEMELPLMQASVPYLRQLQV